MTIKVFKISDDSAAQKRFIDAYLKLFNDDLQYLSFSNIPFSKELVQGWVKESKLSGVEYYVAESSRIEGILIVRFHPIETFEILGLVVDEASRGKGIGSRLVDTALETAEEKGFKAVDVAVFADNKKMLSLVIGKDFKPVRIEYHKRFDGEDVVYLKRTLIQ